MLGELGRGEGAEVGVGGVSYGFHCSFPDLMLQCNSNSFAMKLKKAPVLTSDLAVTLRGW